MKLDCYRLSKLPSVLLVVQIYSFVKISNRYASIPTIQIIGPHKNTIQIYLVIDLGDGPFTIVLKATAPIIVQSMVNMIPIIAINILNYCCVPLDIKRATI